jgi:hypothetical protein
MALTKMGSIVQDIRGTLNGAVYSRNKGGAYVRTKVSPVQPRTPAQLAVRATFALLSKRWSGTLDQSQRAAWAAFATANPLTNVFGDSIVTSGLAAYVGLNAVLGNIGVPPVDSPPIDKSVPALAAPLQLTYAASTDDMEIATNAQATVAGAKYYVFATPNLAPGITPGESFFRFIGAFAATAMAVTIDISSAWENKFGDMAVGKQVWVIVASVNVTTGAVTVGQKFNAIGS